MKTRLDQSTAFLRGVICGWFGCTKRKKTKKKKKTFFSLFLEKTFSVYYKKHTDPDSPLFSHTHEGGR
jgi:hypothetical protein